MLGTRSLLLQIAVAALLGSGLVGPFAVEGPRSALSAEVENAAEPTPAAPPVAPAPHPITDLYGDPLPAGAVARLGTVRLRHLGLWSYFFLPDGKTVRTIGRDGFVRTWDPVSGRQLTAVALRGAFGKATGQFRIHFPGDRNRDTPEPRLALSADRKRLAAIFPTRVVVWDTETGQEAQTLLRPGGQMAHGAFSPDGRTLAVQDGEEPVLLDCLTGGERRLDYRLTKQLLQNSCHLSFNFSRDSRYLAVSPDILSTGPLCVFALTDLKEVYRTDQSRCYPSFSPDGKTLIVTRSAGDRSVLHLIDTGTFRERATLATDGFPSQLFSADGATLALTHEAGKRGVLRQIELGTGRERARLDLSVPFDLSAYSPDGKTIACRHSDTVTLLDAATGRTLRTLTGRLARVEFSPDGKTLLGSNGWNQRLRVWDLTTGREFDERPEFAAGETDILGSSPACAVTPDGRRLAVLSPQSPEVGVWDLSDGRRVNRFGLGSDGHRYHHQIAFSSDGRTLVVGNGDEPLRHLHARTGIERRVVRLVFPEVLEQKGNDDAGAWYPDVWVEPGGHRAVALAHPREEPGCTHMVIREETSHVANRRMTWAGRVRAWRWPAVAIWEAGGDGETLAVVSAETGRLRFRVPGSFPWYAPVAFSSDGRLLAALLAEAGQVRVWETATGRLIGTLPTGRIRGLVPSPDGRTVIVTGEDGLHVWDLATRKERLLPARAAPPDRLKPLCWRVVLTPDGRRAITDVADGTGLVWDLAAFPSAPQATGAGPQELAEWWTDLTKGTEAGYRASWRLADAGDSAVAFIRARLKPAIVPKAEIVQQWMTDLGSDDFRARETAQRRLTELGPQVLPDLRRAAHGDESPEVRRRAGAILDKWSDPIPKGELLRTVRAIAVLERIGTAEARKTLAALAGSAARALETEEAKAALERLASRTAQP